MENRGKDKRGDEKMTREEAIEEVKNYENYPNGLSKECRDYIIQALEQEPILDKIRAEIEHIGGDDEKAFCKNLNEQYKQGLKDALKVIDKCEEESEEKEVSDVERCKPCIYYDDGCEEWAGCPCVYYGTESENI